MLDRMARRCKNDRWKEDTQHCQKIDEKQTVTTKELEDRRHLDQRQTQYSYMIDDLYMKDSYKIHRVNKIDRWKIGKGQWIQPVYYIFYLLSFHCTYIPSIISLLAIFILMSIIHPLGILSILSMDNLSSSSPCVYFLLLYFICLSSILQPWCIYLPFIFPLSSSYTMYLSSFCHNNPSLSYIYP